MLPTGVHVHILRNAVEMRARAYYLKWFQWHNIFTVERCQASALLNAYVLLSFSLDGQMNMLQVSSCRLPVKSTNYLPRKKIKQICLIFSLTTGEHSLYSSLSKLFILPAFSYSTINLQGFRISRHGYFTTKSCDRTAQLDMNYCYKNHYSLTS